MATILVVDDRPINREFLVTLLGYAGHRVVAAGDGAQALDVARAEQPALVISDVLMPIMDGIEFANRLHAEPAIRHIPLIFYTATFRLTEAQALAQSCNVSTVLAKPAEPQVILDAVAKVLGIASAPSGNTSFTDPKPELRLPELTGLQHRLQKAFLARAAVDLALQIPDPPMYAPGDGHATSLRLAALLEVNIALSSERNPQLLLELFCRAAQDIMSSKYAAVGMLVNGAPQRCAWRGVTNIDVDAIFEALDVRTGNLGQALFSAAPLGICNVEQHPEMRTLAPSHPLRRAFMIVPVMLGTQLHGWLYLAEKLGAKVFNEEDEQIGMALAAQLALAYQNLVLYDEVRQHAGQLEIEVAERRRVADQLLDSETRLQQVAAGLQRAQLMAKLSHLITGPDGAFESWSATLPQLIGVENTAIPPNTRNWLDIVDPADRTRFRNACIVAGRTGKRMDVEYQIRRGDSPLVQVRQVSEPLEGKTDPDGRMRWFNTIQDITEQKQQQQRIVHLGQLYAVLSGINSAIMRIHDRDDLLQEACRVAVSHGAFSMAWAGIVDPDTLGGKVVGGYGGEPGYFEKIVFTARSDTSASGRPASVAVRERRSVICNDINTEPMLAALREELLAGGHQSVAAFPMMVDNQAVAVISLFAKEIGFFEQEDRINLLEELAGDLSFGLQFIDNEERLNYLAYYDTLTGLPNSVLFNDRLTQFLQSATRSKDLAAAIVINLDHFSQLNDALGRHAGDAVLKMVAEHLRAELREPYSLARIGGDTFAIAVSELQRGEDAAGLLVQKILQPLNQIFTVAQQKVRLSVRGGIALYPEDGRDAETLFKHAEVALKKAKSSSERFLYYAPQMNAATAARMALESALAAALEAGQFVMYYQPRVDILSGRIIGAEALIRWQHPQRGMVSPAEFIPLAEQTGLIVPIGDWVIDAVCAQQAAWRAQQVGIVPVAVNLSAIQFKKGRVLHVIRDAVARHALEQRHIEFELTESVVMADPEEAIRNLQGLKELGAQLSLDDFGTGYSSLAYLKRFPFDFVKIDRAFVADITNNPDDAAIASAIIAMAHSLGLRVVAEGVETEGQLLFLRSHRCDELQGYYFSRPVPAIEFEAMLRVDKRLAQREDTLLIVDDGLNNLAHYGTRWAKKATTY